MPPFLLKKCVGQFDRSISSLGSNHFLPPSLDLLYYFYQSIRTLHYWIRFNLLTRLTRRRVSSWKDRGSTQQGPSTYSLLCTLYTTLYNCTHWTLPVDTRGPYTFSLLSTLNTLYCTIRNKDHLRVVHYVHCTYFNVLYATRTIYVKFIMYIVHTLIYYSQQVPST